MDTAQPYAQPMAAAQPAAPVTPPAQPVAASGSAPASPPSSPHHFFSTKALLIGAVAALIILVVAGASIWVFQNLLQRQPSDQPITLTYWGLWEPNEVMQGVIERYQNLHPNVTINYEVRPIDNHYATVRSRILPNSTGQLPDIVRMHASWVPVLKNYLSVLPDSVMSANQYNEAFYPVTKDQLIIDDQPYAIPLEIDGLSLVYNHELFTAAGITEAPVTWDDVRQAANKITQRDDRNNILVAGMAMGSARNVDHYADIIGLLMAQNGVQFFDSKGNASFHQSLSGDGRNLGAETLSFFTLFTTENYWSDAMEQSTLAFSKGKVGMILVPSWRVLSLIEGSPQLQLRVVPVPQLTTDQKVGYASYWVETVPKSSPHQAEAWSFLQYLSEQEQQINLFSLEQQIRTFGEPFSLRSLAGNLESDPYLGAFIKQAPNYRASILANDTKATELNDAINAALADAITKVQGSGSSRDHTAADALEDLAVAVDQIVASQR